MGTSRVFALLRDRGCYGVALWQEGLWRKWLGAIYALATLFVFVRDEIWRPNSVEQWRVINMIPHLSLAWWIIGLVILCLWTFEASFKMTTRLEEKVKNFEAALAPQLAILFENYGEPFIHKTFDNNGTELMYVAVTPVAITPKPVKNCVGYLNAVFRLDPDGATWFPTSFSMRQELEWSAVGWGKLVDLDQDTNQPLNVVVVTKSDPRLCPVVAKPLNKNATLFADRSDVFRFDIVVRGDDTPAAKQSLRVALGDAWDDVRVSLI